MYMRAFCTVPTEPTSGEYTIFTPPFHSCYHLSPFSSSSSSAVVMDSPNDTTHQHPSGQPHPTVDGCPANTSSLLCSVRSFIYPTFLVGLNYASTFTTASSLQAAKKASKEAGGDSAASGVPNRSTNLSSSEESPYAAMISAEHFSSTWRELWNALDILYDEVPLFPSLPIDIVNACVSICFPISKDTRKDDPPQKDGEPPSSPALGDAMHTASEKFAALQPFLLPTTSTSSGIAGPKKKKIAVCPHYFSVEPQEYSTLCPLLCARGTESRKTLSSTAPRAGDASVQEHHTHHEENVKEVGNPVGDAGGENPSRVVVLDLASHSDVIASMEKLAVEFAWLAAYFSLPLGVEKAISEAEETEEGKKKKQTAGDILLIRLPFAHVPSVDVLMQAVRDGEGVPHGPEEEEKEGTSCRTGTSTASTTVLPNASPKGKEEEGGHDASGSADASSSSFFSSPPPPAMKAGLAQCVLHLMDFMGQHLSILWESGLQCAALPLIGFIGSDEDETLHGVHHSMIAWEEARRKGNPQERSISLSPARTDAWKTTLLWVMSDEAKSEEVQKTRALLQKLVALSATSIGVVEVEHWSVPLKALKEGVEDEWDLYTQREMARLNFCPCCGDCGHDHNSGHQHH